MIRALAEVGAAAFAAAAGWGAGMVLTGDAQPALRLGTAAGLGLTLSAIQLALVAGGRRSGGGRGRGRGRSDLDPASARRFLQECSAGAVVPAERLQRVVGGVSQLLELVPAGRCPCARRRRSAHGAARPARPHLAGGQRRADRRRPAGRDAARRPALAGGAIRAQPVGPI
jgi:hypothetical protein